MLIDPCLEIIANDLNLFSGRNADLLPRKGQIEREQDLLSVRLVSEGSFDFGNQFRNMRSFSDAYVGEQNGRDIRNRTGLQS